MNTATDNNKSISEETLAVNSAVGATSLSSDPNKLVYDVVADVGDLWQITLDTLANTFTLKVVSTAYGLADANGTISTGTSDGTRTSYTLKNTQNVEMGSLVTDKSTRSVAGNMTLGNVKTSVTGSADKSTELSKLAGTYNFIMYGRNAEATLRLPDTGAGQAVVSADGTEMTLCLDSTVNKEGQCVAVVDSVQPEKATLQISLDEQGRLVMTRNGQAFGRATLLPSNLGKALQMDMYNQNEEGVWRTGVFYFAEAKAVREGVINGAWTCSGRGTNATNISILNSSGSAKNLETDKSMAAVFKYNQVANNNGLLEVNGFVSGGASSDAVKDYDLFMPLSSSLLINEVTGDSQLRMCRKTG